MGERILKELQGVAEPGFVCERPRETRGLA
jgi:hypothetical protein